MPPTTTFGSMHSTVQKKVGSDGNHVCAGIKIRLPNKGRGAKKLKDTKSNEET